MKPLTSLLRRTASACLMPLASRAARSYIAGPDVNDAVRVAGQLSQQGYAVTLGFWDGPGDTPASVAAEYLAALEALSRESYDGYLSIKFPAIGNSGELLEQVLERAQRAVARAQLGLESPGATEPGDGLARDRSAVKTHRNTHALQAAAGPALAELHFPRPAGIRIHFDSLAPEAADAMWSAACQASASGAAISCSLPGRWRRSLADADAAIDAGIVPRVVKGQWPDADDPQADLRRGFMKVVNHLAGRAPHVAIASHDAPLTREAIACLRAAGTTSELELLYGLPERASLSLALREHVPVRFYVPYGKAYLPYCLGQARRNPRLLWWLMRDALRVA
jgi:proline dehydrogenase